MPKPRAKPRKQAILEAARRVLESNGVDGLTVLMVAERVPISEASVFYHFRSKDELLLALAVRLFAEEISALTEAAEAARNGIDAICAMLRARVDHYRDRPEELALVRWAMQISNPESRREMYAGARQLFDVLEKRLRQDVRDERAVRVRSVRRRIVACWVMSEGLMFGLHQIQTGTLDSPHSIDDLAGDIVSQIRTSLKRA